MAYGTSAVPRLREGTMSAEDLRVDISVRGVHKNQVEASLDIRVSDTDAFVFQTQVNPSKESLWRAALALAPPLCVEGMRRTHNVTWHNNCSLAMGVGRGHAFWYAHGDATQHNS